MASHVLTRRTFCFTAAATALAPWAALARTEPQNLERALDMIARHVVVDLHAHPGKLYDGGDPLPRLRDLALAKITAFGFAIPTDAPILGTRGGLPQPVRPPEPGELYDFTVQHLTTLRNALHLADMSVLKKPADILRAKQIGRPGALIALEGGDFLAGRLERVAAVHALGVHSIQLVHFTPNALGTVRTQAPNGPALSDFGHAVVREQNRLGLIVDVTHMTREGVEAVAATSRAPVMLSHTGFEGHYMHGRGVHLATTLAVKATGGVIGLRPLGDVDGHKNLGAFADEMMHLIEHVGIDYVALGTDMDGAKSPFKGYGAMALFIDELFRRDLGEEEIAKIIGGNFVRLFSKVMNVAETG
ncbi:dipeptidase [Magnetovibrio sp.]|uniref:dipeptidase n=1 Tax=Magnetovibrio sp. TaxID=2024836 RepID=UPI002F924491